MKTRTLLIGAAVVGVVAFLVYRYKQAQAMPGLGAQQAINLAHTNPDMAINLITFGS